MLLSIIALTISLCVFIGLLFISNYTNKLYNNWADQINKYDEIIAINNNAICDCMRESYDNYKCTDERLKALENRNNFFLPHLSASYYVHEYSNKHWPPKDYR